MAEYLAEMKPDSARKAIKSLIHSNIVSIPCRLNGKSELINNNSYFPSLRHQGSYCCGIISSKLMIYLILPRCYYQLLDTVAVLKVQNNQYIQDITVILCKLTSFEA